MDGLVRIGRFSELTRLSVRSLRKYDGLGLLEPAEVDSVSGYRSYRLSQANRAEAIRVLRSADVGLDDIATILGTTDTGDVTDESRSRRRPVRIDAESIADCIDKVPDGRKDALRQVCNRIEALAPDSEPTLELHMPFYKRHGGPFIAVASQKHHLSLYVMGLEETLSAEDALSARLDGIDRGKNCLRFRDTQLDRIDPDLLDPLIDATITLTDEESE